MAINNFDPIPQSSWRVINNERAVIGFMISKTTEGEYLDWNNLLAIEFSEERRPYQRYMKQH